jgi:AraC family transcriptional regulator
VEDAIARAISIMWARYSEPLSLDAMANSAYLSRFYFSRLFRSTTGTSPGRFLTAIRLYKAKNMLLDTRMSVTDIAYGVGYNSLGTFTSRFTRSVGTSPARYRWLAQHGVTRLSSGVVVSPHQAATISGRLMLPALDTPVRVYVGIFDSPIVQGLPPSCAVVDASGEYRLRNVPAGEWYVRAAAIGVADAESASTGRRPLAVGAHKPIKVAAGANVTVDLSLHPTGVFDLPILIALPELDSPVLDRVGRRRIPQLDSQRTAG